VILKAVAGPDAEPFREYEIARSDLLRDDAEYLAVNKA